MIEETAPTPESSAAARVPWARVALQVLVVLVAFAVVGAAAGWVWERVWDPPSGVVYRHRWFPDEEGVHGVFSATGWYVVVAVAAGLLAGVVTAFAWARSELVTLASVVVGSVVGAWVMHAVGTSLGPADPREAARSLSDGSHLVGALATSGRTWWVGFPTGAVAGVAGVFLGAGGHRRQRP